MSLVRDLPFTVVAMEEYGLFTCSKIISTGTTGAVGALSGKTTAAVLISTGGISVSTAGVFAGGFTTGTNGRLIDRLMFPIAQARYNACVVQSYLVSTLGTTETDAKIGLGVKLLHGDSSGGGDLAEYWTANQPDDRIYFATTVRTCDMLSWDFAYSTGQLFAASNPGYYDLRGAKRYLTAYVRVGKNKVTTETSGSEGARVGATITFLAADQIPFKTDVDSPYSSTTSTA